jgi:integrase
VVHVPKLGRHSSGQSRVVLSGQTFYLGEHGTPEAAGKYAELLARWEAGGRQPLRPVATVAQLGSVASLVSGYLKHIDSRGRFRKSDGRPTSARARLALCMRYLVAAIGDVQVRRLRAIHLRKFIDYLVARETVGRPYLNKMLRLVKAMFKHAYKSEELTRAQYVDLQEVECLSRLDLPNRDRKVAKFCPSQEQAKLLAIAAGPVVGQMIRVQVACGARPGELLAMRWCDLSRADTNGFLVYTVPAAASKTAHVGKQTTYLVSSQLLDGLTPTSPTGRVFHEGPATLSNYARALARASKSIGLPRVVPHALRHCSLTAVCREHGALAAQAWVGHANISTTQRYLHVRADDRIAVARGLVEKLAQ